MICVPHGEPTARERREQRDEAMPAHEARRLDDAFVREVQCLIHDTPRRDIRERILSQHLKIMALCIDDEKAHRLALRRGQRLRAKERRRARKAHSRGTSEG